MTIHKLLQFLYIVPPVQGHHNVWEMLLHKQCGMYPIFLLLVFSRPKTDFMSGTCRYEEKVDCGSLVLPNINNPLKYVSENCKHLRQENKQCSC